MRSLGPASLEAAKWPWAPLSPTEREKRGKGAADSRHRRYLIRFGSGFRHSSGIWQLALCQPFQFPAATGVRTLDAITSNPSEYAKVRIEAAAHLIGKPPDRTLPKGDVVRREWTHGEFRRARDTDPAGRTGGSTEKKSTSTRRTRDHSSGAHANSSEPEAMIFNSHSRPKQTCSEGVRTGRVRTQANPE